MAKEAKAETAEAAPPPAKSKKLLIIVVALVVVLAIAGGGVLFLLKSKKAENPDDEETAEATQTKKKPEKKKDAHPPVFVNLEPFTVNLVHEADKGDQYLQVALSVELEEPTADATMKANMPKIRNSITMLLSGKKASELLSREGKEALASELKEAINEVLDPPAPQPKKAKKGEKGEKAEKQKSEGPALAVLFTSFIIQ